MSGNLQERHLFLQVGTLKTCKKAFLVKNTKRLFYLATPTPARGRILEWVRPRTPRKENTMAEHMQHSASGTENRLFLGYATVPVQTLSVTYSLEEAMREGTIFPELNLPINVYGKEGFRP